MKIFSLLADQAQIDPQAKVHAIGLNWTTTRLPIGAIAVIVFVDVPAEDTPASLRLVIKLVDSTGEPVKVPSPPDGRLDALRVDTSSTATLNPERSGWEPVRAPFVVQIGPNLPISPGDYSFEIAVSQEGGETATDELRFHVKQADTGTQAPEGA